jgi:hypothetical protein
MDVQCKGWDVQSKDNHILWEKLTGLPRFMGRAKQGHLEKSSPDKKNLTEFPYSMRRANQGPLKK